MLQLRGLSLAEPAGVHGPQPSRQEQLPLSPLLIPLRGSSEARQLWSFREIRSFEEGAKNTSRKAWKDGDGFVAAVVALLFPF